MYKRKGITFDDNSLHKIEKNKEIKRRENMNESTILKCENLTKIYGNEDNKTIALDDVSFSVKKGQFVSIIEHLVVENLRYYIYWEV